MCTLKHKLFIRSHPSRKRKLQEDEEMYSHLEDADLKVSCSETEKAACMSSSEQQAAGPSSASTRRQHFVRFSSTLDLITKPYLPSLSDAETLKRYKGDMWYTRDDYRTFYQDRIDTVRVWRSMARRSSSNRPHKMLQQQQSFELRGLENYQSGSVSAELNQQRAEYMGAVLSAEKERQELLRQNKEHEVRETMIRDCVEPLSHLAVERAQYLAAQDAADAARFSRSSNSASGEENEKLWEDSTVTAMQWQQQSPAKKLRRCFTPPESPSSVLGVDLMACSGAAVADVPSFSEHRGDPKVQTLKQKQRLLQHMKQQQKQQAQEPSQQQQMQQRRRSMMHLLSPKNKQRLPTAPRRRNSIADDYDRYMSTARKMLSPHNNTPSSIGEQQSNHNDRTDLHRRSSSGLTHLHHHHHHHVHSESVSQQQQQQKHNYQQQLQHPQMHQGLLAIRKHSLATNNSKSLLTVQQMKLQQHLQQQMGQEEQQQIVGHEMDSKRHINNWNQQQQQYLAYNDAVTNYSSMRRDSLAGYF